MRPVDLHTSNGSKQDEERGRERRQPKQSGRQSRLSTGIVAPSPDGREDKEDELSQFSIQRTSRWQSTTHTQSTGNGHQEATQLTPQPSSSHSLSLQSLF